MLRHRAEAPRASGNPREQAIEEWRVGREVHRAYRRRAGPARVVYTQSRSYEAPAGEQPPTRHVVRKPAASWVAHQSRRSTQRFASALRRRSTEQNKSPSELRIFRHRQLPPAHRVPSSRASCAAPRRHCPLVGGPCPDTGPSAGASGRHVSARIKLVRCASKKLGRGRF